MIQVLSLASTSYHYSACFYYCQMLSSLKFVAFHCLWVLLTIFFTMCLSASVLILVPMSLDPFHSVWNFKSPGKVTTSSPVWTCHHAWDNTIIQNKTLLMGHILLPLLHMQLFSLQVQLPLGQLPNLFSQCRQTCSAWRNSYRKLLYVSFRR